MAIASSQAGARCPGMGFESPTRKHGFRTGMCCAFLLLLGGCQDQAEERTLPSVQVAMDRSVPPIYDDGELVLYEVRVGSQLPILAPTATERATLDAAPMDPYGRTPWVTLDDVRLQLSWTITNLDDERHTVELLIDPWNEFAKYFPGLQLVDADNAEFLPNLSGIDYLYVVEGKGQGEASRRHGTFTFDDLDEMARDFATVMNLVANPPAPPDEDPEADPTIGFVNHAFAFQNHSSRDPLVQRWVPSVVPALTGFDVGLRTFEPAAIAIEIVAEVVDLGSEKVQIAGRSGALLEAPTEIITVGEVAP